MLKELQQKAKPIKRVTEFCDKGIRNKFYWSASWREMKNKILLRDYHECRVCKSKGKVTLSNLIVHHIYPLEYYPEKRLVEDNLITVCIQCHNKIHGQGVKKWDDEWW
ncbi:HNH endonuclease [Aerococcaceae bacterium NML201209]|nr:HNH endonuclease [Aerococcaceae bacterium NML201209]